MVRLNAMDGCIFDIFVPDRTAGGVGPPLFEAFMGINMASDTGEPVLPPRTGGGKSSWCGQPDDRRSLRGRERLLSAGHRGISRIDIRG